MNFKVFYKSKSVVYIIFVSIYVLLVYFHIKIDDILKSRLSTYKFVAELPSKARS